MDEHPGTSEEQEGVDPTPSPPAASPSVPSNPPRSDPDSRIRQLMSQNDKLRNDYAKAVAERAEAQKQRSDLARQHDQDQTEKAKHIEDATKATQDALDAAKTHEERAASLDDEVFKLRLLADNPDLTVFRDTIMQTPRGSMEVVLANLKAARQLDRSATIEQLKTGTIPPASPNRPEADTVMTPAQLKDFLRSAKTEQERHDRMEIVKGAKLQLGQKP